MCKTGCEMSPPDSVGDQLGKGGKVEPEVQTDRSSRGRQSGTTTNGPRLVMSQLCVYQTVCLVHGVYIGLWVLDCVCGINKPAERLDGYRFRRQLNGRTGRRMVVR